MDYMLSTLALWLPEECRAELARQTAGRDPRFSDVRWLPEGETAQPLEREFLYVGGWSAAAARAESDPEVWILSADPAGQGRGRLLLARGEEDLCRRLYQGLRDAFFALNRWVIDLDAAVMENASLQALTDLSGPILRNPVVFFDTGFSVLAHTGNLTERDAPLYEVVRSGTADPGTILQLQTVKRTPPTPLGKGLVYQSTDEICGQEELFVHLTGQDGAMLARMNMRCRELPATDGLLHLLQLFLGRVTRLLERHIPARAIRDLDDYLFRQLMDGVESPEQVARVLGIPARGEFIAACLAEEADSARVLNIASQLERVIPLSRPFLYEKRLMAFVGINTANRSVSSFWDYQRQRLEEIGGILRLGIGVSDVFDSLSHLKLACTQARAAVRLGERRAAEHWSFCRETAEGNQVCRYRDVAIYDTVDRLLRDAPPEGIGSPAYWEMRRHDQERGTNNCQVLSIYLKNDCEAAPTADALHMHRNSIVYRVNKLAEAYDLDLKDPQAKLLFQLSAVADELTRPAAG